MNAPLNKVPFTDRKETLAALLDFTAQPQGSCYVLLGKRGIGKTRVLRKFVRLAEKEQGNGELQRICVLHEPTAVLPSLMNYTRLENEIVEHPAVRQLIEEAALEPWSPDLNRWLRKMVTAADPVAISAIKYLDPEELVIRLLRTDRTISPSDIVDHFLRTLLFLSRSMAEDQRLILVFDPRDDVQIFSSDPSRIVIFQDIVRNLPERVLILLALRSSTSTNLLRELLQQPNVVIHEDLTPFQVEDVRNLLQAVFQKEIPVTDAHRICRRYGGDPATLELAIRHVAGSDRAIQRLAEETPTNLSLLIDLTYRDLDSALDRLLLRTLSIALEPVSLDFILEVATPEEPPDLVEHALTRTDAPSAIERLIDVRGNRYQIDQLVWVEYLRNKVEDLGEGFRFHANAGKYYENRERPELALAHYVQSKGLEGIRRNLELGLEWHRIHGETQRIQTLYKRLQKINLESSERFLLNKSYAWSWSQRGEAEEVLHHVEELLEHCKKESVDYAELLILQGDAYHNSSLYEEAYQAFGNAQSLLERLGLSGSLPHRWARLERAHIEIHLGNFTGSETEHYNIWQQQDSLTDPEDERTRFQSAREIRRYGELLVFTGDWKRARDYLDSALEFFIDLEDRKGQGNALRRLADLDILAGGEKSFRAALRKAEYAKELLMDIAGRGAGWMDLVLGEAYRGLGRLDEAFEAHGRAWSRYESGESPHLKSMTELALAECERTRVGIVALEPYMQSVERYEQQEFDWGLATALTYRALAHLACGDVKLGHDDLDRAQGIFEHMDLQPPLAIIRNIRENKDLGFYPIIVL